ncbi:phospho-N-acetylmuramoyl-pentapeptide-transferase homolog isoform X2 [Selaginella moellendorffii]|uniref:phospho-N-acetylmuramoyl-pentapeptide- transferase homolog isoform X2 n=1 Tax=Selaginella moellendorffii TaxID=88036 RepID=UPI000D1C286D|nr:phospho-N-acetylmuramoyl-pentapeptide-transferase homolog isoform X2 [Selaginella moellendorffii]|eukprot:XP_024515764.1 phospho-N-acetylmuramoyl-pentapeptide-transferase homolog isoform X2 [Selaginella moellendorffii]
MKTLALPCGAMVPLCLVQRVSASAVVYPVGSLHKTVPRRSACCKVVSTKAAAFDDVFGFSAKEEGSGIENAGGANAARAKRSNWQGGLVITLILSSVVFIAFIFVDSLLWRAVRRSSATFLLTAPFVCSLVATGCLGSYCVPLLAKLKAQQIFRVEGPASHLSKAGTPTMGGLFFIPVGVGVARAATRFSSTEVAGVAAATLVFAAIGLLDDFLSLAKKHNYGVPGPFKFLLEVVSGVCFFFWLDSAGLPSPYKVYVNVSSSLADIFSFLFFGYRKNLVPLPPPVGLWNIGKWYLPLTAFCFAAMANGVNLTDGLDGLAGGTAALAFAGMAVAVLPIYPALGVFGASMAGACVGFLLHNRHKASVFMGDTGSLALGAALAAMASCTGLFLPLFIASGVFVIETVSVMAQVAYFRYTKRVHGTGRRLLRMAPFHHHLEHLGMEELHIVAGAYLVSALLVTFAAHVGLISA